MTTRPATVRRRLLLVLWTAGAVSVACNVLAAEPSAVGRAVAAWPPVALLLVVEVLARSPLPPGRLRWTAAGGAGSVAVVAAVASFHHMHSVAGSVGESALVAILFPLSVDGLAVVASVALLGTTPSSRPRPLEPPADVVRPPSNQPTDPGPATEPSPARPSHGPPGSVSLFVPALSGASSPVLNGSGPMQPTTN